MISDKFRHQLRHEAEIWRAEGLIDDFQYEQLSERYQFNSLDIAARNRFVTILIGLGSILIGLGVITFVAANWQDLPRTGKVTLLLSLFIGVNIAGFYLWRRPNGAQQRLGHGLLLLGALILGANMGLMGQMFHISSPFYELLLAWGVGVLAMAYSLRLTSLGVMSIILIWLGYWGFWGWSTSSLIEEEFFSWSSLMGQHMPLLAGLMFVPLAYWCRSGWIFALGAIAVISSLEANIQLFRFALFNGSSLKSVGWILAIAFALPPALLWGYDDSLWVYRRAFQPIARNLALFCLGVLFYLSSSTWFWSRLSDVPSVYQSTRLIWFFLLDALILSGLAIFEWLRLAWLPRKERSYQSENLTTIVIGVFIAIAALVPFWHISVAPISVLATFIFNVLLFLLAAGLMREGLAQGERRAFWSGMVLLTLRILSWFLLSATGLLFKSLIFILCGVGVISVGLWFERYVRTRERYSKKERGRSRCIAHKNTIGGLSMTHSPKSRSTTPVVEERQSQLPERLPAWRLWVPLLLQTGLILAAPAQPFYTQLTGKTVVLQTIPVDPYDPLRGYSQTLNYDISRLENLRRLPGWKDLVGQQAGKKSINSPPSSDYLATGTRLYVILEAPASAPSQPAKAWKPVRVSSERPTSLPANQIALKGKYTGSSIEYGLETYYMPESRRAQINQDIIQAQRGRQQQSVVVEVKVDAQGRAVPISFWVSDASGKGKALRNYRF